MPSTYKYWENSVDKESSWVNLYNSHLEFGVRVLVLLREYGHPLSLQQIIYLDYFFVHLGDLKADEKSLHPDIPYRSGEILVKRKAIKEAIDLMVTREMIGAQLNAQGLFYKITDIGNKFLSLLTNEYFKDLEKSSKKLFKLIKNTDEESLRSLVQKKYSDWGAEFSNESILEDFTL